MWSREWNPKPDTDRSLRYLGGSVDARTARQTNQDRLHVLRCWVFLRHRTKDRHILKIEPAEGPANGISTCVKGKFGWDYVNAKDRLTKPLIRDGETFREATWKEALDLIANKLSAIKNEHGPDAIGLIASSKCTNEESFLMQKLARAVIGTNNIDNCSRYCQTPATMGLSHRWVWGR